MKIVVKIVKDVNKVINHKKLLERLLVLEGTWPKIHAFRTTVPF